MILCMMAIGPTNDVLAGAQHARDVINRHAALK